MSEISKRATIARIWRGRTRRERADEYEVYNYEVGIKPLIEKALSVQCFREDRETEAEFITVSYWESIDAMSRLTSSDPTRVHHLDRDKEFLIELPERVQILEIRGSYGDMGVDTMDEDLHRMTKEQLASEVKRLRQGIRKHRDSTGHELCWHHPALWGLLPDKTDPVPVVPEWPQFMEGCVRYRQSLDEQAPNAPRTKEADEELKPKLQS